jgi:DNA-binding NtrC family response regulator
VDTRGPWADLDLSGSLVDVTRRAVTEVEKVKIGQVLREMDNNKGHAAEVLGISYKTLLAKLKEHRIE